MLLQIPGSCEAVDDKGKYRVFNIYVNGTYHCSLRYSQLLDFYTELKQNFDVSSLDEFPPKHLLSLSDYQLEGRRRGLERFLHSVCQDRVISESDLFNEFLLAAQQASSDVVEPTASLDVYLVNGKKVTIELDSFDASDTALEKVASAIELQADLTYYFGLFLEKESSDRQTWSLVRSLQDFEAPYISLLEVSKRGTYRVTIRANFWDPKFVDQLLEDKTARNLLYIEALWAIGCGQVEVDDRLQSSLDAMQKKAWKKEYLQLAKALPYFCYRQLEDLSFDHPKEGMRGVVRVGGVEIVTFTRDGGRLKPCQQYSLTKMRCWKVGYKGDQQWISFHYQITKDKLVWITFVGSPVPFISLCMHTAVSELLRKRNNQDIRKPGDRVGGGQRTRRTLPRVKRYQPPVPKDVEGGKAGKKDAAATGTGAVSSSSQEQTKDDLAGSQASSSSQSYEAPSANSSVRKGSDREEREEARENGGDEQGASVQSQAGKLSTTSTTMAAKPKPRRNKSSGTDEPENPTFDPDGVDFFDL